MSTLVPPAPLTQVWTQVSEKHEVVSVEILFAYCALSFVLHPIADPLALTYYYHNLLRLIYWFLLFIVHFNLYSLKIEL